MSQDYPPDWDRRRQAVYKKDGYQCQNCGRKGGPYGNTELHAHHIVPKSRGGTHAESNLVTVCKDCHLAIHGKRNAPTRHNPDVEKWREITGDVIDDSKRLIVDVDSHIGKINDLIAQEEGFDLVNQNPANDDQLWSEKEDLRRRFYSIESKAEERKQYENDVTPVPVQNAISEYISSFENYIKATIDIWSFFENISRGDAGTVILCPNCERDVETNSNFCRYCGAEIDWTPPERQKATKKLDQKWERLQKQFNEAADKIQIDLTHMENEIDMALPNETAIGWDHCPNCGFENSVWLNDRTTATCRFCQARWEKSGLIFKNWKMVAGEEIGDCLANHEWEDRGLAKNREKKFEDFLKSYG